MADKVNYLTDEGRRRLQEELHYLRTVRRPEIAQRIADAKREGDVSENAGYEDAKHEQSFVEGRIEELEAIIQQSVLIKENKSESSDVVTLGCHVTICEDRGVSETYHIVGSVEADPLSGSISNECPLGKALLGRRRGETVVVKTPVGSSRVQILNVEYR